MHLLVTRPLPDATATAGRLRALGHAATVEPLLSIAYSEPPADLPDPAAIVVTSRNGVRALARWPAARGWHDRTVFAAGQATAAAAREAGFGDVRAGHGDTEALADLVGTTLARAAGIVLYPAARDRAGGLESRLAALGFDVSTVEAYRAEPADRFTPATKSLLVMGAIGGALFYSRRTALAFRALIAAEDLDATARDLHLFVISQEAGEPLGGLGAALSVAAEPTEESLLALLPAPG